MYLKLKRFNKSKAQPKRHIDILRADSVIKEKNKELLKPNVHLSETDDIDKE